MNQSTMGNETDIGEALLSHVELCYSVALALTRNPNRASALARETLSWAWHRDGAAWDPDTIKMALLRELRERHLRHGRSVPHMPATCAPQLQEVGA